MAFAASKPVILTDSDWARLENTDSYNTENLTQASKAASSYGRDIDSVMKGFQTGNSMKMPVVLERPDNTITLVGGNTRLMAARVLGIQPTVLWISSSNFSEPVNSMDTTSSRVATESHHSPREGDDVSVSHIESKFRLEGVLGDISGPASLSGIATMFDDGEILFEPDDGSEINDDIYGVIVDIVGDAVKFPPNAIASRVAAKYLSRTADSSNIVSQVDDILNGETNGPHGHDDVKYDEDIIKWCKEARKTVPKMQKIFDDAFHDVMDFKSEIPDSKNPKIRQLAHGKFSEMLSQAGARVEIISHGLLQEIEALCNGLESGASRKKKASMKPSQLASQLRRIASKIDNSKSPDRTLVARDLKKILAGLTVSSTIPIITDNAGSTIDVDPMKPAPAGFDPGYMGDHAVGKHNAYVLTLVTIAFMRADAKIGQSGSSEVILPASDGYGALIENMEDLILLTKDETGYHYATGPNEQEMDGFGPFSSLQNAIDSACTELVF
jgi:hypothetical protein